MNRFIIAGVRADLVTGGAAFGADPELKRWGSI